jgi:hypothetical protein
VALKQLSSVVRDHLFAPDEAAQHDALGRRVRQERVRCYVEGWRSFARAASEHLESFVNYRAWVARQNCGGRDLRHQEVSELEGEAKALADRHRAPLLVAAYAVRDREWLEAAAWTRGHGLDDRPPGVVERLGEPVARSIVGLLAEWGLNAPTPRPDVFPSDHLHAHNPLAPGRWPQSTRQLVPVTRVLGSAHWQAEEWRDVPQPTAVAWRLLAQAAAAIDHGCLELTEVTA